MEFSENPLNEVWEGNSIPVRHRGPGIWFLKCIIKQTKRGVRWNPGCGEIKVKQTLSIKRWDHAGRWQDKNIEVGVELDLQMISPLEAEEREQPQEG